MSDNEEDELGGDEMVLDKQGEDDAVGVDLEAAGAVLDSMNHAISVQGRAHVPTGDETRAVYTLQDACKEFCTLYKLEKEPRRKVRNVFNMLHS